MNFEDDYFKGEEKLGYYISPMMKRKRAVMLDILEVISDICSRHSIKWYADSGTLLGAVRHGGFIPWDDDLDIAMFREDYEHFIQAARDELPEGWLLYNGKQDPDPYNTIMMLINTDTVNIDPEFLKRYHGCPYIIGVDIFVIDSVPDDPAEDEIFRALLTMAHHAFSNVSGKDMITDCSQDIREEIDQLCEALDIRVDRKTPVRKQLLVIADQIGSIYNETGMKNVTIWPFYINRPEVRIPASCYDETVYLPFELCDIPAPSGYEQVLSIWFGPDYMTPRMYGQHADPAKAALIQYYEQRGMEFPKEFE